MTQLSSIMAQFCNIIQMETGVRRKSHLKIDYERKQIRSLIFEGQTKQRDYGKPSHKTKILLQGS